MQSDNQLTLAGLERRVKQHVVAKPQSFFAVCAPGFEPMLLDELKALKECKVLDAADGGVGFEGPYELVHDANLFLNTAVRVLMRIDAFVVRSYPELFDKVSRIPWERYLGFGPSFTVTSSAKKSRLHHDSNVEATTAEAIVKTLASQGVRIKVRADSPLRVYVRIHDDECTISIDSSGDPLYKRGVREAVAAAPLRESTAAALLQVCDFDQYPVIADPLCGSGTFLLEAARMLRQIPAGGNRRFAFERWPSFREAAWNHTKKKALAAALPECPAKLYASDMADSALKALGLNAGRAGLGKTIMLDKADCVEFNRDNRFGSSGLIVANLPYGKRSGANDPLNALYAAFGKRLRESCRGWRFGLLLASPLLERRLDLRADRIVSFENGGIPVRFISGLIGK